MKRTVLIAAAVVLLGALPLWLAPADGGERFAGADDRARQAILQLAPDYRPWLAPLLEPAGTEMASLLFALQAALGAGMLGYWLGAARTRERLRREAAERNAASSAAPAADAAEDRPC